MFYQNLDILKGFIYYYLKRLFLELYSLICFDFMKILKSASLEIFHLGKRKQTDSCTKTMYININIWIFFFFSKIKSIPAPSIPPLWLFNQLIPEIIEIAIVSFALNISMAKLFAKRYKYTIRPNQELFAYGIGNFLSSLFKGFPTCVGLSRCVILEGTGAKTLLHSAITSSVVLVVIVGIGFLFRTLPTVYINFNKTLNKP